MHQAALGLMIGGGSTLSICGWEKTPLHLREGERECLLVMDVGSANKIDNLVFEKGRCNDNNHVKCTSINLDSSKTVGF